MFKCCVCHGKASRRTSQEDDEDDSSREDDESSSSESESDDKDEDEEEREIEEELAKKFKCQNQPNTQEANVAVVGLMRETLKEENEEDEEEESTEETEETEETESSEKVVVEVNGDVRSLRDEIAEKVEMVEKVEKVEKVVDREAIKEDVVEILNNAVKIVQEIRRGEWERLEKIKEEASEETASKESSTASPAEVDTIPATSDKEIDKGGNEKPELEKLESDETEESVITVIQEEEGEYEIVEEIKNDESGLEKSKTDQIEEMIIEELIHELSEEADNDQELKEIIESTNGTQEVLQSEKEEITATIDKESQESTGSPIEEPPPPPLFCEVEIVDEIKKTEVYKIENNITEKICTKEEEIVEVNVTQEVCPSEDEAIEEKINGDGMNGDAISGDVVNGDGVGGDDINGDGVGGIGINDDASGGDGISADGSGDGINGDDISHSDLLNIPPPATPPPEEAADFEKLDECNAELDFPTPPPIDFDVGESSQGEEEEAKSEVNEISTARRVGPPVPPWEDELPPEVHQVEDFLPVLNRQDSKPPSSPGSKSLPSPPSPGSETGCETEAESKSSSDEQTTKVIPCGSKTAFIQRTVDDGPDDDGDDSVFETVSLAKDPEVIKDIPPRPGCEHDDREEHLEELVNRLENVTKRLEQVSTQAVVAAAGSVVVPVALAPQVQTQEIAVQTKSPSPERSLSITEELQSSHCEEVSQSSSSSRESTNSVSGASVVEVVKNMSVNGYQDLMAGPVLEYIQLSQKIGGDVAAHCKLVEKAFQIQLHFLQTAASRPAPTNQSEQVSLLAPTSKQIQEIQEFREKNRGSAFFNHLSAISESIPALGWVAVSPTPAPYVKEMNDAGQFYTNRVLKDWKEKDKTHVEWCKAWVKTLTDLQQFVRQHHTTGLVWAKTGSVPAGGVPPPPPPSMMPMADPAPMINDDRSALFAEINQGENITKNLKKVTSDMQTHKNTNLRTGPAPFKAPFKAPAVSNSSPVKTTLPANAPIDKPPVFTRDGKKWLVEYHKGNKELVIDNVEMNNVVYMFRCQDSNLIIKGKINSVVMDSCRKCAVVVDSVVASIEFVNCQSVQMQVIGKVPTISIDKTDGCQMYLNKDTLDVELITSKSSEMNVMVPIGNGDYTEYPVPEQFKTLITPKGLSTTAVDSLG